MTGDSRRQASYQKRSEAKVSMGSSAIAAILKKRLETELKGRPRMYPELEIVSLIHREQRGSEAAAWPGKRGGGR